MTMIYFAGDIHGKPDKICRFCQEYKLTKDDVLVLLGDVGANYYGDTRDKYVKAVLDYINPTVLCIHGNHEQRPANIEGYKLYDWHGGKVWGEQDYPSVLFARDGDIYTIGKYRYLVIGGAYSVDKYYRLQRGYGWWADEQPSEETKAYVEKQVAENKFDVILSHTCPFKYEPIEAFLPMIEQDTVDDSTEKWLDKIEKAADYKAWFCGHWHINKRIDKMHFLYDSVETVDNIRKG